MKSAREKTEIGRRGSPAAAVVSRHSGALRAPAGTKLGTSEAAIRMLANRASWQYAWTLSRHSANTQLNRGLTLRVVALALEPLRASPG